MDVVTLFAIVVFAVSWYVLDRTPEHEVVVRVLMWGMVLLGALVGLLGIALRLVQ